MRELGSCLLHLEAYPDQQVGKRMTQLVNECQDLLNGTYEGLHSAMAKAIAGGNLEQALAATAKLDCSFWHQILVRQPSYMLLSVKLATVTQLQCTQWLACLLRCTRQMLSICALVLVLADFLSRRELATCMPCTSHR